MRQPPREKDIRHKREQVALQFREEVIRFDGLSIVGLLPNYRFLVRDGAREYRALVLPSSFSYYQLRLHVGTQPLDMLIVSRHNAVVPLVVVSLEQVTVYESLAVPKLAEQSSKYGEERANLLLSKYLLNFESAQAELAQMSAKTRQRYHRKRALYLKKKVGRPFLS